MLSEEGVKQPREFGLQRLLGIEPLTIVMDLEGTDGRERGEDDTTFEKQSALLALAVADVVLINMWCHDIGREQASNKPLLKTVFQVMMRLFSSRKTTLLFVIRDKTKTPLEYLEPILREDIQKIWGAVRKPKHTRTPLSVNFSMSKSLLYPVAQLRQLFFHSISPRGLAGDRRGVVPVSVFSYSAHQIWKVIKENKDLDLPAHKVMVVTVRCEEIANQKFSSLMINEDWLALEHEVKEDVVRNFGRRLCSILDNFLSENPLNGILAGLISVSSRFLPTVMDLLRRLAAEAHGISRTTQHVASQSFRNRSCAQTVSRNHS
ncbi:hypothetical protein K7X08_017262 [Anisodus acutangulus]|uniref:GB1/RHD3-type G domain-containing protein n=1 Tax=Anisodus acutangulus TaxID=402998 RepID=A0A9Q1R669_9SOLA|nr:hypothetical protein K7X08_017262 [Anisodus acutangulus]